MKQNLTYTAELSDDVVGNITRINNALERIPKNLEGQKLALKNLQRDLDTAKEEVNRPFPQEAELETKSARLSQLNIELVDHLLFLRGHLGVKADGPALVFSHSAASLRWPLSAPAATGAGGT